MTTTENVTCGEVLEALDRLREYHQGRADAAARLQEGLKGMPEEGEAQDRQLAGDMAATLGSSLLEAATPETPTPEHTAEGRPTARRSNAPLKLVGINVDFTGAQNLRERIRRIAVAANDQLLSPTVVARFLIESGQHTSTVVNLRPAVYRAFRDQPHL